MPKRLWLVISLLWMLVFLLNGASKEDGVGGGDLVIAALPLLSGPVLRVLYRFVAYGSRLGR